jgi:hypothetical protein
MKRFLLFAMGWLMLASTGCSSSNEGPVPEPDPEPTEPVERTVVMFYPWSTNLKSYFLQNIDDFATMFAQRSSGRERVVVCIESSPEEVDLIELKPQGGATCAMDTVEHYSNPEFTTEYGITSMLKKVKALAPADHYSMIIGCHGMGWLPSSLMAPDSRSVAEPMHFEITDAAGNPLTRYFGGLSWGYVIDISTLAHGIEEAKMTMDYILFDDCYMSSVEVAYELRGVTRHLIACPTEVMAYGFPYQTCGKYLIGDVDYEAVCDAFYDFYISYSSPYGTIAVTDCSKLDDLAAVMTRINAACPLLLVNPDDVQAMDGYSPTIFYDMEDVVRHQCTDPELWTEFEQALAEAVPYKRNTPKYYTARRGPKEITTYGGITTSSISTNEQTASKTDTDWWFDTH